MLSHFADPLVSIILHSLQNDSKKQIIRFLEVEELVLQEKRYL